MAKEQVQIVFSANTEQARAIYDAIAKGQRKVGEETDKVNSKFGKTDGALAGMLSRWVSIGAAIGVATQALNRYHAEVEKAADKSRTLEDIAIRVSTQGGFARGEEGRVGQMVADLARRNRFDVPQAGAAVEQLISSGFNAREVLAEGGSGDEFVRMLHAINASGRDQNPRDLALAISKFLTGTGQPLNAQSVRGLGVPLFNLFQGTNIQAQHLQNLGPVAASLKNRGMSPNEQLAVFSSLVDIMEPSVAATGLSALSSRLASSAQSAEVKRGLGMLGLGPTDVDMVGESFIDVMDRIKGGSAGLNPAQQAGAFKLIAGQEHLKTLENLVLTSGTSRQRLGMLGATGQYGDAIARRLSGLGAAERDVEARGFTATADVGDLARENKVLKDWIAAESFERGDPGFGIALSGLISEGVGMFSQSALNRKLRSHVESLGGDPGRILNAPIKVQIDMPNKTSVPGTIKATEHIQ